jgi:murein DD-endopeptidase MepM/ murein hydrolase activator NlpD
LSHPGNEGPDAITVMVVPGGTGTIRRFLVPRKWIKTTIGVAVGVAVLLLVGLGDYVIARSKVGELDRLRHETEEQRVMLQEYADRIEQISAQLAKVGTFERKLRVIANLDPADPLPLPGVGGIEGEGLEPHHLSGLTRGQRHKRMLKSLSGLSEAAESGEQRLATLVEHLESQTARLAATPSIAPAKGWVTSQFGYRQSPFTGRREFHRGIDIAAREGTPILSPADGRVRFVGEDRSLGKSVIIKHGYGVETVYGHLSEAHVAAGDRIKRGERLGLMGSTGRSTGPHLHYQINVNGSPVSPQNYMLD